MASNIYVNDLRIQSILDLGPVQIFALFLTNRRYKLSIYDIINLQFDRQCSSLKCLKKHVHIFIFIFSKPLPIIVSKSVEVAKIHLKVSYYFAEYLKWQRLCVLSYFGLWGQLRAPTSLSLSRNNIYGKNGQMK